MPNQPPKSIRLFCALLLVFAMVSMVASIYGFIELERVNTDGYQHISYNTEYHPKGCE